MNLPSGEGKGGPLGAGTGMSPLNEKTIAVDFPATFCTCVRTLLLSGIHAANM